MLFYDTFVFLEVFGPYFTFYQYIPFFSFVFASLIHPGQFVMAIKLVSYQCPHMQKHFRSRRIFRERTIKCGKYQVTQIYVCSFNEKLANVLWETRRWGDTVQGSRARLVIGLLSLGYFFGFDYFMGTVAHGRDFGKCCVCPIE